MVAMFFKRSAGAVEPGSPDSCSGCAFWMNLNGKGGRCRRYPPSTLGWPLTNKADWCGEHLDKVKAAHNQA
jgi:hypothetical protein